MRDNPPAAAGFRCPRRDLVRAGLLAMPGLTLPTFLQARADSVVRPFADSCILLWLDGGPSHLETFDLKPDAPAEVRGPFRAIQSSVPGMDLSELLPQSAGMAEQFSIIRSVTSPLGEHGLANQYLLSGYQPSAVLQYPGFGAVVSHLRPTAGVLPAWIAIPQIRQGGAGYLGARHEPFSTGGDPAAADFRVPDLNFFPGIDVSRLNRRQQFLQKFDGAREQGDAAAAGEDPAFQQAYRLVTSSAARDAFDLSAEPEATRDRYGRRTFGQSCLLARRLVERGVPFVSVMNSGWDTHENLVVQLKDGFTGAKSPVGLIPAFDLGFSALIRELAERGLLQKTLVVVMGEFGRTPKLNSRGGRDHWPRVFSVIFAGGGVQGGQVVGSSDRTGESPADRPVTPADLARTIYWLLGIDATQLLTTPDGRPVAVNQGGQVIQELT